MKRAISFMAIAGLFLCGIGMVAFLLEGRLTTISKAHFIIGVAGIVLFAATRAKDILQSFRSRTTRFGALVSAYVMVVLAIIVVVNVIGAILSRQLVDFTESGLFTLAPATRNVLAGLKEDIVFHVFIVGGRGRLESVRSVENRLLRTFEAASQKVKLETVDPNTDPETADKYKVSSANLTVIMEYQGRTFKINTITEENISNGIIRLLDDRVKTACFTTGHGEPAISGQTGAQIQGLGLMREFIERKDYVAREVDLRSIAEIPADCTVVMIAGPQFAFSDGELVLLDSFLQYGGRVFVAADAGAGTNLEPLLNRWGIRMGNNVVMEKVVEGRLMGESAFQATTMKPTMSLSVIDYNCSYPITQDMLPTQYFAARSIEPMETVTAELKAVPLMWSKKGSWVETDIEGALNRGVALLDPNTGDRAGPVCLAVASSLKVTQGYTYQARLVAVGNAQWMTNRMFKEAINANPDLLLNMIGWLAGLEQFIGITPKSTPAKHLNLNMTQRRELFNVTVIFIPEFLLLIGALVWWIRR